MTPDYWDMQKESFEQYQERTREERFDKADPGHVRHFHKAVPVKAVPVRKKVYLIGSLRNPAIPAIANELREAGFDVVDDWYAAGPEADDKWQTYEKLGRGRNYAEALQGLAATHVFDFDYHHIQRSDIGVLVTPAGKSGHLELGYMLGQGKQGYVLINQDPDRWDVMYKFATAVVFDVKSLVEKING